MGDVEASVDMGDPCVVEEVFCGRRDSPTTVSNCIKTHSLLVLNIVCLFFTVAVNGSGGQKTRNWSKRIYDIYLSHRNNGPVDASVRVHCLHITSLQPNFKTTNENLKGKALAAWHRYPLIRISCF